MKFNVIGGFNRRWSTRQNTNAIAYGNGFCNINKKETFYYEYNLFHEEIRKQDETLGSAIAYNRTLYHMSQLDLANRLNLNVSTIRRYESNKLVPSKYVYSQLLSIFGNFYSIKIDTETNSFGEKLKISRLLNNMTLREVHELTGLSMSALSSYEANRKYPNKSSLIKLRTLFNDL